MHFLIPGSSENLIYIIACSKTIQRPYNRGPAIKYGIEGQEK